MSGRSVPNTVGAEAALVGCSHRAEETGGKWSKEGLSRLQLIPVTFPSGAPAVAPSNGTLSALMDHPDEKKVD
ncbi:hypothetical protein EYF80_051247 [Liparis tanakae]|uniref:Uncharacterized protein n=1 Tax=Liparis tanakae TaxID=230148 RepID=A0A4Z2FCT9_9TELE|nr:hypothetical protein EYF80_051247 [Liparis tanakae]